MNFSQRNMQEFYQVVQLTGLVDLGFTRPTFTCKRGSLQEHIDRALANHYLIIKFPNVFAKHIFLLKTYHKPIEVCMKLKHLRNRKQRPFRFVSSWITHKNL